MRVTVVIATYGEDSWRELAWSRAYPSAIAAGADDVIVEHDEAANRAEARNRATARVTDGWIVTLDADDELDAGYCSALRECGADGERKLLVPRVAYVRNGSTLQPRFWPEYPLDRSNWMVVGTAFPKALFDEVGGWRAMYRSGVYNEWEDWELWIRMTKAGAVPVKVPDAVYVAHVNPESAAQRSSGPLRNEWLAEVRDLHFPPDCR